MIRTQRKRVPLYEAEGKRRINTAEGFLWGEVENVFSPVLDNVNFSSVIEGNLTKTQKSYIMLYYKENKTVVEIAEMFHVNKSTVSRTINRGKANLFKALGGAAS